MCLQGMKTYGEYLKDDIELLGLLPEYAIIQIGKYSGICGGTSFMGQMSIASLAKNK